MRYALAYAAQSLVQPYVRSKKGRIKIGEVRPCSSPEAARRLAERMVAQGSAVGALALRVGGDPEMGEFDDPEVLAAVGEVPAKEQNVPF